MHPNVEQKAMHQLPKIFIAYAREDKPLLHKLRTHLNVMKRQQHCEIFYDGEILPGESWDDRLKDELHTAHIFVLLVTAEFLDSDYVHEIELPKMLERRSKGEAEVIAVILKDCLWELTELERLQVVLKDERPIESADAYAHAAREVFRTIAARNEKLKAEADQRAQKAAEEAQRRKDKAAAATHRALDPFHNLLIPIKGGAFQMGDEHGDLWEACRPVHAVTVPDFSLCKHPVTQAQWRAVMGSDPPDLAFKGCDDCPVERVSWNDVQVFLQRLNEKTDGKYRLPAEAEWEYAARGGQLSRKAKYAGSNTLDEVGWYKNNSLAKTHPVMQKQANELGLYDMSGNVWEWCADAWHENYKGAPKDGSAWMDGGDQLRRVVRGGSWVNDTLYCQVAYRSGSDADNRYNYIGFRLAR